MAPEVPLPVTRTLPEPEASNRQTFTKVSPSAVSAALTAAALAAITRRAAVRIAEDSDNVSNTASALLFPQPYFRLGGDVN